jgi:hypothetical protein
LTVLVGMSGFFVSSVAEEAAEKKNYILYTGANLQVMDGEEVYPVVGVSNFALSVSRQGRIEKIPLDKVGRLWIEREMKLNKQSAVISNLRSKKAFTPGRETTADWGTISTGGYANDQGTLDNVAGNFFEDEIALQKNRGSATGLRGGFTSSAGPTEMPGQRGREGEVLQDALEVSLDLASGDSIADPYLVLVTDYHDPAVPDQFFRKFMVKVLNRISPDPVSIRLLQDRFPAGFEVEEFNLYLYSGGKEIPTNLSDKQVALTTDEAYQYLILEYLVGHKGETLAPRPMWVGMPAKVKEQIRNLEANPQVDLILDKKGRVIDLTVPSESELGPDIIEALRAFRFYPTLENGKAVEGSYALRPKELVR